MTDTQAIIVAAIASRRCIDVTYNRMRMKLAPHILYTRHGDLFTDAVVVEREGKAFTEIKLGTFKLIGLQDAAAAAQGQFHAFPGFDASDAKYQETTPFAIA
jgi:hypothetical protein